MARGVPGPDEHLVAHMHPPPAHAAGEAGAEHEGGATLGAGAVGHMPCGVAWGGEAWQDSERPSTAHTHRGCYISRAVALKAGKAHGQDAHGNKAAARGAPARSEASASILASRFSPPAVSVSRPSTAASSDVGQATRGVPRVRVMPRALGLAGFGSSLLSSSSFSSCLAPLVSRSLAVSAPIATA
jgi:hypothetical protein